MPSYKQREWTPESQAERHVALVRSGEDPDAVARIAAFSDAVFAIAMTLLVLTIDVPTLAEPISSADVARAAVDMLAPLGYLALSFFVTARFWMVHHARFRSIVRYDLRMMTLNFVFLFCIVVLPLPTELVGRYGTVPSAQMIYAGAIGLTGLASQLFWLHAAWRNRLTEGVSREAFNAAMLAGLIGPMVFLLSIPVSLVNTNIVFFVWSTAFFLPGLAARIVMKRRGSDSPAETR